MDQTKSSKKVINEKFVHIRIRLGGEFVTKVKKGRTTVDYEGGWLYLKTEVSVRDMTISSLRYIVASGFMMEKNYVPDMFRIWYRAKGRTLGSGRREFKDDGDIGMYLETIDKMGILDLYVTVDQTQQNTTKKSLHLSHRTKLAGLSINEPKANIESPTAKEFESPLNKESQPISTKPKPQKLIPIRKPKGKVEGSSLPEQAWAVTEEEFNEGVGILKPPERKSTPRVKHVAVKGKNKKEKRKKVIEKGKKSVKSKAKRRLFDKDEVDKGSSSEEDLTDVDWELGEEEFEIEGLGESFLQTNKGAEILKEVQTSLKDLKKPQPNAVKKGIELVDGQLILKEEPESDSDELRSLDGSDSDAEVHSYFNSVSDFRKPIQLKVGLRFSSNIILREALRKHAVENRYDFYYLHNDRSRISIYCKYKCNCPWNVKKARKPSCFCENQCPFKVYASCLPRQDFWEIKSLILTHTCVRRNMNSKLTAEYLGERYLEEWRVDPNWKLKAFLHRVLLDTGAKVSYWKARLGRARSKFFIYGAAEEEYEKVWDYGLALYRYIPGTRVAVVVDYLDQPEPPIFLRMFVALNGLVEGFTSGCRPIIGLDGCHLKGAYPGQILVAVGKDGNNNIFPFAWATVEVENKETWCWFLEMLMKELSGEEGEGWTFMSDRQKGLLEAFNTVVPKAETRFCVRHIWANFKLQFTGSLFKELFWSAARATTQFDHEVAMESIKFLNEEAYEYLANIPTKHWCRHAFSTQCKSNMLLNNMCETFNSVIRDARDKPILTQMEWLRRYMMKRCNEKWEAVKKMTDKNMPYIKKTLEGIEYVSRSCTVQVSRDDTYEVQFGGDQVIVDLEHKICTCYHWQLTGIPCIHAYACIMDKRQDPHQYVDEAYSRETYMMAYGSPIPPLPGSKHWPKMGYRKPRPPEMRTLPGRPKSKKRRKEKGEDEESQPVNPTKRQRHCSNCNQLGHRKTTCKNPTFVAEIPPKDVGGRPPLDTPWVKDQRKKREQRATKKVNEALQVEASSSQAASKSTILNTQQSQNMPAEHEPGQSKARQKLTTRGGKTNTLQAPSSDQ